jgi:hypothetical protein
MTMANRARRKTIFRLGMAAVGCSLGLALQNALRAQTSDEVPRVLATSLVRAAATVWNDRACLAVELTDEVQARVVATRGGNGPSYAIVARDFVDGVIEVDVASELTHKGGADARGFVGVAFHVVAERNLYEAVYLRMANGRLNAPLPPAPRVDRAIQYVAHPNFHFNVSRTQFPGRYERGADVALGRWHRLRLEIEGRHARVLVDGNEALVVEDLRYSELGGSVGLFIDDGSRGFFHGLSVRNASRHAA